MDRFCKNCGGLIMPMGHLWVHKNLGEYGLYACFVETVANEELYSDPEKVAQPIPSGCMWIGGERNKHSFPSLNGYNGSG